MANVEISIPDVSDSIKTVLSQDFSSGTILNVDSTTAFANSQYIVIGEPGLEKTEVAQLTSTPPDNLSLNITTLKFSHPKGTPIYYTDWDKYSLEYRISSTAGWNIYANMPTNINFDAQFNEYRDAQANSNYEWRYRYWSSEKSAYSEYSDTIGTSGWGRNTVGYMVKEIRKIVNDPDGKTIKDAEIIRFLNSGQDKVYTLYDRWWFLFKTGSVIPTVTGTKIYNMPSDFGRMHSVQYRYVFGSTDVTYDLEYKSITEFDRITQNNNAGNDDNIRYYSIYPGDANSPTGYLKISGSLGGSPATAGLSIIPRYFKTFTDLSGYSDATEVPVPDVLENYVIGMILDIRKEDDKSAIYLGSLQKPGQFYQQIELLKLMQRKNARPMRYLWEYKGTDTNSRYFGNRISGTDADRANNW